MFLIFPAQEASDSKKELVMQVLRLTMNKDDISLQKKDLSDRIIGNLRKANSLVLKDLLEWEKDLDRIRRREEIFHRLEEKSYQKLKTKLEEELDLFRLLSLTAAKLYYREFEEDELEILIRFYSSKAGRKALSIAPRVHESISGTLSEEVIPLASEIAKKTQNELIHQFMEEVSGL